MVEVLLVLKIFLTDYSWVEDLLCGAPFCSEACLFFRDDILRLCLQSVQYYFQHDFAWVTDEADGSVVLERIMTDALEDHEGTVSIGSRTITNLRLADDIGGLAGEEEELAKLDKRLNKDSTAYGIEINAEKTKLMTNNTGGINTEIKVNGQKLETVTSFKKRS